MSIAIAPMPILAPTLPRSLPPQPKRWTCAEFHDLGDRGMFEGRRAMLIEGVILEQGPMNPPHAIAATKTEDRIRSLFTMHWHVRVSKPLVFGLETDPEPDVAVVVGKPEDYSSHPTTSLLIVEVSDTTLAFDTGEKASLYAAGKIADYWVVDVNGRQLLVFRDPQLAPTELHGHSYTTRLTFTTGQSVAPLAAPNSPVAVVDLLP